MTPVDIIDRAVELLRTEGWCQGTMLSGNRRCLMSALSRGAGYEYPNRAIALTLSGLDDEIERRLVLTGFRGPADNVSLPVQWNDAPGRTVDELIAFLESVRDGWPREATWFVTSSGSPEPPAHLEPLVGDQDAALTCRDEVEQRELVPA